MGYIKGGLNMIQLMNASNLNNTVILTKKEQRGAQNFLTELPSGISARYFEERIKSYGVLCKF